jgi:hypothetical protein
MAVAPKGVAANLMAAFAEMYADPRRAGAFYAGLTPTLAGIIPYSGCTWATYETIKEKMLKARGEPPDGELPPLHNALAGGFAGILGQTVSYPLDVVRRRMQTATLRGGALSAPGMVRVFGELLRSEGVRGLYKGLSVNFLKAPVAMGISFSTYAKVSAPITESIVWLPLTVIPLQVKEILQALSAERDKEREGLREVKTVPAGARRGERAHAEGRNRA